MKSKVGFKSRFFVSAGLMTLLVFCLLPSAFAKTAYEVLDEIPVQQGGRIKPFASFAREAAFTVTGQDSLDNMGASALVWAWIASPEKYFNKPILPVSFRPLRQELGIMVIGGKISPELVLGSEPFVQKVRETSSRQARKEPVSLLDKKRAELYASAFLFQQIANGETPGWLAHPQDPRAGWMPLQGFGNEENLLKLVSFYPEEGLKKVFQDFKTLIKTLGENPASAESVQAAVSVRKSLQTLFESRDVALDRNVLQAEITYDRLHPFGLAWKLYLMAAVFLILMNITASRKISISTASGRTALLFYLSGFLVHAYGFYLRCLIAGRPPVSNMYESIIWVSWAVSFFSLVLFGFYRSALIPLAASLVAALALGVAESFPAVLNPAITPLVPVLRSNLWLTIHVLTITLSYGAFALAWGIGHFAIASFLFFPKNAEKNEKISLYLYRAVQIGVVLLAAGTVLGGVWANYSWGRFWGWDPKETWALIALLGYLAVLHGRFAGWLGTFGTTVGCVAAFLGVVMAWYGVNYVLAAGLHSYGFGGGGAPYVLAICLLDMALVFAAAFWYRIRVKRS